MGAERTANVLFSYLLIECHNMRSNLQFYIYRSSFSQLTQNCNVGIKIFTVTCSET